MMLWKCCTQYTSKFGELSSGPGLEKFTLVFIPIPKKSNAKECSNYHTITLLSHASKEMLKILLNIHWKDWCWSWNSSTLAISCEELTHWKRLWCWEGLGAGGEGDDKDEMARWHHWLNGCESEWTPGVGDGQGGLACCDSWGRKESDTTEQLNWERWYWWTNF